MKNIIKFYIVALLILSACTNKKVQKQIDSQEKYVVYGQKINDKKVMTSDEMLAKFNTIKLGDTVKVKFVSKIKEVCVKKGCWMKLPLGEDNETMVRFKDYGFFMPLDSKGKEVIVNGKAFVQETSVEELQHYAEDAGKSKEEIAKITESKKEFAFEADGVLMKVDENGKTFNEVLKEEFIEE